MYEHLNENSRVVSCSDTGYFPGKTTTVQNKMAPVHFKTPCEPNTTKKHIESHIFCEIRPCTNNIVYARFEVFRTFLCVFMSVFRVFVR